MKHVTYGLLAIFMLTITVMSVFAASTVEQPADCLHCGMNRSTFAHSRGLVEYQDGKKSGVCSINCAIVDLKKNKGKKLKSVKIADFGTKKLINTTTAFWVIGGDVDGVMTRVPKWAFSDIAGANKFVTAYGGIIVNWESALAVAKKEAAGGTH